ncbi:right-handed parallel beta-helix repeat-containing protein [Kitasatospora sp. NPDC092948]|uniref:DUF7507 domain-containing protein n=1 Tax=Kitasatospora sp. NPDC092948 TaxID=3364088 RepID=UPI003813BFE2
MSRFRMRRRPYLPAAGLLAVAALVTAAPLPGVGAAAAPVQRGVTITVNETAESATYNPPGPVYSSQVSDPSNHNGLCSLREAIEAANTQTAVDGCPAGGPGTNTIVVPAGTYVAQSGFFVLGRIAFVGANAGNPGYGPRTAETVIQLEGNPGWRAHQGLFWLNTALPQPGGVALGAGSTFDGFTLIGTDQPMCDDEPSPVTAVPCDLQAIVEPSQNPNDIGFDLRNSIVSGFSSGLYLGGKGGTVENNLFRDNNAFPDANHAVAAGVDVYSDSTLPATEGFIQNNVFADPAIAAIDFEGGEDGQQILTNVIDTPDPGGGPGDTGMYMFGVQNLTIAGNTLVNGAPPAGSGRTRFGLRFADAEHITLRDNTLTGYAYAIAFSEYGLPPGPTTGWNAFHNRIYNNDVGLVAKPDTAFAAGSIVADDNWWGANGGPGSTGARTLPASPDERSLTRQIGPVNGIQLLDAAGNQVPNTGQVVADTWLHLTCSLADTTVPVGGSTTATGAVTGMPVVDHPLGSVHYQPVMVAAVTGGIGSVSGFGVVPQPGAVLDGTFTASAVGSGAVQIALDAEQVECPLTTVEAPASGLSLSKSANPTTVTGPGDTVTYTFTVTNTGGTAVENIVVDDPKVGPVGCPGTGLAAGGSMECTATYTVTEQDAAAGEITNTATVSGAAPDGSTVTSPPASTTVRVTPQPSGALSLSKSADPATVHTAGQTVTYTFTVTNTGDTAVENITVDDPKVGPVGCPGTGLAAGSSMECTATYTVTEQDIAAGEITNTATATGTASGGSTVTSPSAGVTVAVTPKRPHGPKHEGGALAATGSPVPGIAAAAAVAVLTAGLVLIRRGRQGRNRG